MKQIAIVAAMSLWGMAASAQLLEVQSIKRVPTSVPIEEAVISPDGLKVVASTKLDNSLLEVNLEAGSTRTLTDNGDLYQLKFSSDSKQIAYVAHSYDEDHLAYKEVRQLDLATGDNLRVLQPTRKFGAIGMSEKNVIVVDDNSAFKMVEGVGMSRLVNVLDLKQAKSVASTSVSERPLAYIHFGDLMVSRDGVAVAINPNKTGDPSESYLWPSISPDGSKVLYYLVGYGAFVCDLDGQNVVELGDFRDPQWVDDNVVVGMLDADDGYRIVQSSLVAKSLSGESQLLTDDAVVAIYPTVNADGTKISFTTPMGELYIMNVKR